MYNKNNNILINNLYNKNNLPYSIEAEQSIIGCLMINNNNFYDVLEKIDSNDFYIYNHKVIFNEMKLLIESKKPIDLITISESLNKKKNIENVEIFIYLSEISRNIPSIANLLFYTDIVKEKSIIREIIISLNDIYNICLNPNNNNLIDIINYTESKLFKIINNNVNCVKNPKNINFIIKKTIDNIYNLYKNPKNIIGLSSGYYDLDEKTLGFQKSDLIIIAARPSMGKTTFAINICENIIINNNKPVLIFSLEMSEDQIIIKILSSLTKIDQTKIKTGNLSNNDWIKIKNIYNYLIKNNNLYIDDSSSLTPYELRSRARKIFRENNGLSLIMIDYLQLINVPSLSNNRTMEITEISRCLKSLAKELNIPIIALSQLNRSLELRSDKRPINSDLRESGSIEQDADLIIFIYRDEIYNKINNNKGIAEIILSKHRNGPTGLIKLFFNNKISRFDNYTNIKKC